MSGGVTVRVDIDYKDALKRLDKQTVSKFATAALEAAALLVANQAKRNAPVRTGTLRRSIHVGGRQDLTPDFEAGGEYSDLGKPGDLMAIVGTNLEYAPYQEYGTSRNVPATHFLGNAMDSERDAVLKEVAAAFGDLVAKELG